MHIVCAAHCISGRQKSWFQVCSPSRPSSSSTSTSSPFPSTFTQVVAGAHNIHSILPEDTVQKRKVADMWAVSLYFSNHNLQIIPNNIRMMLSTPEESQITGLEYLVIRKCNTQGNDPNRCLFMKHEGYDHSVITNDVSVLKLNEPLEFNE